MKNRKPYLFTTALLMISILSFGQMRNVGDFHAVRASSGVSVKLIKSNAPSVNVEMKKGDPKNVITEVKGGILFVKIKSNKLSWGNSTQAKITVNFTELDEVQVSSGSTLRSDDVISASSMEIEVSSGSTAHLMVDARTADVEVTSGSTLKLKGEADTGKFEANSGSTINAGDFETDNATAEASSGSTILIHVNDTLNAEANSGASIRYSGDVKHKNFDKGWSGSISRGR